MAKSINVRQMVIDLIKPKADKTWVFYPYKLNLDSISRPTCVLDFSQINKRADLAPDQRELSYTLTIISPFDNPSRGAADDALDASLFLLLGEIDAIKGISWSDAKRVAWETSNGATYPAYDVTLTLYLTTTELSTN